MTRIIAKRVESWYSLPLILGAVFCLGIVPCTWAEHETDKGNTPGKEVQNQPPSKEKGTEDEAPKAKRASDEEAGHLMPASELIGYNVQNQEGKIIGEVKDLMIRQSSGSLPFVVVSFGGLGLKDEGDFAIPWKGLRHDHVNSVCILSVQRVEKAPFAEQEDWVKLSESRSEPDFRGEYGVGPYWVESGTDSKSTGMQGHFSEDLSANAVLEAPLVDETNEDIGKLSELMIDFDEGRVAYTVLQSGGILGIGGEKYSIPWEVLKFTGKPMKITVHVDKDRLKTAPQFKSGDDPVYRSRQWGRRVYETFDLKPYWVSLKEWTEETFGGKVTTIENNPDLISGNHLVGANVVDSKGEEIGQIENVAIDPNTGEVILVLISCGGIIQSDGRLRGAPFAALSFDSTAGAFRIGVSKDRFYEAPSFSKTEVPRLKNSEWSERVRAFYQQGS